MTYRLLTTATLIFALYQTSASQSADWPLVVVDGHVTFVLPPSMEVDSASFDFAQNADGRDIYSLRPEQSTIFAGSRENDGERASEPLRAASLIVDIDVGEPGSYASLGTDLGLTQEDLEQLNEEMRVGFSREAAQKNDMHDIEWGGTYILQLDVTKAINLRLKGLAGKNDDKYVVNIYIIQNYDAIYYVTISYLDDEAQDWIPDLSSAFESFRFVKRDGEQ